MVRDRENSCDKKVKVAAITVFLRFKDVNCEEKSQEINPRILFFTSHG